MTSARPRLAPLFPLALLTLSLASSGCNADGDPLDAGPVSTLSEGDLVITSHNTLGTYDVARAGTEVVRAATADVFFTDASGDHRLALSDACGARTVTPKESVCEKDGLILRLEFDIPSGKHHLTAQLTVENHTTSPITIKTLAPLVVDSAKGSALFLGDDPARHRILENGRYLVFDQTSQIEAGDAPPFPLGFALPFPLRGNSVSNWTQLVADLDDPSRSLVAGWLTADRSIPTLGIAYDASAPAIADGSRAGFTTYAAESSMVFHGKQVVPGESLASELLYFDPLPGDPLEGMERFADELAAHHDIIPWPERGPGREVPIGWNSWTGGGSGIGGYGQAIDHDLIAANMDVFKQELQPFGANYFQVDDGWQVSTGDWQWKPDTFPQGGAAMAAEIAAAGFHPGLWLAPFGAQKGSKLAADHPDWLLPKEDGLIGALVGKDKEVIDPSNPDVRHYLHDLFTGLRSEGWQWAKCDFTYYALLGKLQKDTSLTAVEAWRAGWKEIRDGLGPDVFLLGVGVMGPNVGTIDSMRLTLDNGPKWDETSADDVTSTPRAFKGTVRTGARRWFYQNRVWVSHDDLIFFRSWPPPDGADVPPISLDEARTFATWIALGGGVVELGDKLLDLADKPEWIDILRRLMPVWPQSARPLDILSRDYPEEFREHVVAKAGEWDVVGLLNWGTNRDLSTSPPTPLADAARSYTVHCDGACLVYEFWSGEYLGEKSGDFEVTVDARRAKVLALRRPEATPQLLGTNRHVTQGATDLGKLVWDASKREFIGSLTGSVGTAKAPWVYSMAFRAPPGFELDHAEVDLVNAPSAQQDGEVVRLSFSLPPAAQGKVIGFRLFFK